MYIFDNFPDRAAADAFANDVRCLGPWFAQSMTFDKRRDDLDPFPFELVPPVVYVDRNSDDDTEQEAWLEALARERGGKYAGT